MKNYLLVLVSLFLFHSSYSQTYQYVPMPTSDVSWKGYVFLPHIRSSSCYAHQWDITGVDTIIGVDTYYQLRWLTVNLTEAGPNSSCTRSESGAFATPLPENPVPGYLWFIEHNKKVYVLNSLPLDTSSNVPYLDFNLDSVGQKFGISNMDSVISIDTINVQGTLRKRMIVRVLYNYPFGGAVDTIVEGIGGYRFGLGFEPLFQTGLGDAMNGRVLCMTINNQLQYKFGSAACDVGIWPLSIDKLHKENNPFVYPNPFSTELNINADKAYTISVYNSTGKLMYRSSPSGGDKVRIETRNWPPGLYLSVMNNGDGESIQKLVKY